MTITATTTAIQIPGNGSATVYSFPMKIFAASDVVVGFIVSGAYTAQGSGFTVTNIDVNGGGNVVFATAPPFGTTVDIRTLTPQTQGTDFTNIGPFLPEDHTEALDRVTREVQDIYRLTYSYGVHGPDQESVAWPALPNAAGRANSGLIFDSQGLPAIGVIPTSVVTQSTLVTLLGADPINRQTPAEAAALVIPANLAYVSGDLGGVVARYGALGVGDDSLAIQAALNSNTEVTLQPGVTYTVSPNAALGLAPEGGTLCLNVKSGQRLIMYGATLKQLAGTSASGAIIGNIAAVTDVRIEGGTVDCNGANTTGNQSGIVLWNDINCDIVNVKCLSPRWIGIGHRGTLNQGTFGRNGIKNCRVEGALFISIQCSRQALGLQVHDCWVENGVDNGIDVEGDVVAGDPGVGARISIQNCTVNSISSGAGVFIESCPDYIIQGCTLENIAGNGIALNRIHSGAMEGKILGDTIKGIGQAGVWINNSTGKISIDACTFKNMVNSVQINSAGVSFLSMGKNTHEGITGSQIIKVTPVTNALIWTHIAAQDYYGARVANLPFTISPLDNTANHSDRCNTPRMIAATNFLQSGVVAVAAGGFSDLQVEYQDGATGLLTIDGTFGGQYSLFTGGETQIHPSVVTGAWTVGDYIWIAGTVPTLYKINSAIGGGIFTIRTAAGAAGNFTANFTGAHPSTGYLTQYQTD